MRWEDERYVRFYTRDTPEWLALSWRARGLFGLVIRSVDRAGVIPVGKLGKKGLAVAVHAPWAEVEAPILELLEDGCLAWDEARSSFFVRNFLEAQECAQSDAARKRASRERVRAQFDGTAPESQNVTTGGHETGPDVTNGHGESRLVTPSVPSRTEPSQEKRIAPSPAVQAPTPFSEYVSFEWPDIKDPLAFENRARAACPAVDLLAEAKKARGWELSDTTHRKRNHGKFFWGWVNRAQQDAYKNSPRGEATAPIRILTPQQIEERAKAAQAVAQMRSKMGLA